MPVETNHTYDIAQQISGPHQTTQILSYFPLSIACPGRRDESRQHSRAEKRAEAGALVLTCPRAEQLMLCVVATSGRVYIYLDDALP